MRKLALLVLCAVAACSDDKDAPPQLASPQLTLSVAEDGTLIIDATAQDPEDAKLIYTATQPAHGTLTGTGPTYTYTPVAHYNGLDSFNVTLSDGVNTVHLPVIITITPVEDTPVVADASFTTNEDQGVAITLTATDFDGTLLGFTVVDSPSHGTLTGVAPNLTYTPDKFYSGVDSFTYQASDGTLTSTAGTVSITVEEHAP